MAGVPPAIRASRPRPQPGGRGAWSAAWLVILGSPLSSGAELFAPEPGPNGTGCPGLHAAPAEMSSLPAAQILRCIPRTADRSIAQPGAANRLDRPAVRRIRGRTEAA